MHRRTLIFGPLALYATACRAAAWALITKEEFERDSAESSLSRSIRANSSSLTHR